MSPRVLRLGERRRGTRMATGVSVSFSIASLLYFVILKRAYGPEGPRTPVDRFHHERPAADEKRIILTALNARETVCSPVLKRNHPGTGRELDFDFGSWV